MKDNITADRIQPLSFDFFVGMDVDKKSIVMTIMDQDKLIKSKKVPYDPESITNYFSREYSEKRIAFVYEAGPTGWGLYDAITERQYTCLVASPNNLPAPAKSKVKNNRLDSVGLANLLRGGQIKGVRVPSEPYRKLRHLVHIRDTFVKQITATKCRIKALLLLEGLAFPEISSNNSWSGAVLEELKTEKQYEEVRFELDRLLEALEFAHKQMLVSQQEIRRFCKGEADIAESIKYMLSVPGVGQVVATEILARTGDWRLLKNAQELGAFLGLTPSENSTGEKIRRGSITKTMRGRTRNKLIEGSWSAIRQDGELLEHFRKIKRRNPKASGAGKAIVAVARKITSRIYRVLKDRRFYEIRVPVGDEAKTKAENKTKGGNGSRESFIIGVDSRRHRTKRYVLRHSSLVRPLDRVPMAV